MCIYHVQPLQHGMWDVMRNPAGAGQGPAVLAREYMRLGNGLSLPAPRCPCHPACRPQPAQQPPSDANPPRWELGTLFCVGKQLRNCPKTLL